MKLLALILGVIIGIIISFFISTRFGKFCAECDNDEKKLFDDWLKRQQRERKKQKAKGKK